MVVAWTYSVAVNFVPGYRNTVDRVGASTVGLRDDEEAVAGVVVETKPSLEKEKRNGEKEVFE